MRVIHLLKERAWKSIVAAGKRWESSGQGPPKWGSPFLPALAGSARDGHCQTCHGSSSLTLPASPPQELSMQPAPAPPPPGSPSKGQSREEEDNRRREMGRRAGGKEGAQLEERTEGHNHPPLWPRQQPKLVPAHGPRWLAGLKAGLGSWL